MYSGLRLKEFPRQDLFGAGMPAEAGESAPPAILILSLSALVQHRYNLQDRVCRYPEA